MDGAICLPAGCGSRKRHGIEPGLHSIDGPWGAAHTRELLVTIKRNVRAQRPPLLRTVTPVSAATTCIALCCLCLLTLFVPCGPPLQCSALASMIQLSSAECGEYQSHWVSGLIVYLHLELQAD